MKTLLTKTNKMIRKIFRKMKNIEMKQAVSVAMIFGLVFSAGFSFPKKAHAACALSGSIATSYNWAGCGGEATISGTVSFAAGTHNLGATNLTINNGGVLIPAPSSTTVNGANGVIINSSGSITINAGGSINANGQGYLGGSSADGYGEGKGLYGYFGGQGGAHAGRGGRGVDVATYNTSYYGNASSPVTLGSGSGGKNGGAGGGAIKINTSGTVTINGSITANGAVGTYGAGAGGSIWIISGTLTGSNDAVISANGGAQGGVAGGGGGGGRISLSSTYDTYAGSIKSEGGLGAGGGGAGSIVRTVVNPGDIVIAAGKTVTWSSGEHMFSNVTINSTGTLTTGTPQASSRYDSSRSGIYNGAGLGGGICNYATGSGGSHASQGGTGINQTGAQVSSYNSDGLQVAQPTDLGSGGGCSDGEAGGAGGGAIKLTLTGTLTNNGTISANGNGSSAGGGGSGGSIWINTPGATVSGSGSYNANGGNSTSGGGGSGGRISFSSGTNFSSFSPSSVTATEGTSGNLVAGAGTINGLLFSSINSISSPVNSVTSIAGTAANYGGSITSVDVSIRDNATGYCLSSGGSFNVSCNHSSTYNWLTTTLSGSSPSYTWSRSTSSTPWVSGNTYSVISRANSSTIGSAITFTFDNTPPTITLSSSGSYVNTPFSVAVETSEATTNFASGDVTVTNGTVSGFSGSGTSYSFTVTPTSQGAVTVNVGAGTFTDAATNGNTASNTLSVTYDSTAPTVALTSTTSSYVISPFSVTATFSESVTGFALGDITVTNGTASNLSGSGDTYTFTITPADQGEVIVAISAGIATDLAGNLNRSNTDLSILDSYGGGKIVYVLQSGDLGYSATATKGLIAATADQGTAQWGCYGTIIGVPKYSPYNSIGYGSSNTDAIIAGCSESGIAAKVARAYNGGGYSDWYLPNTGEMSKLWASGLVTDNTNRTTSNEQIGQTQATGFEYCNDSSCGGGNNKATGSFQVRPFRNFDATFRRTYDSIAPTLSSVALSTNNSSGTYAKTGNTVTVSFTSSETISPPTVTFTSGGVAVAGSVTVTNTSGNNWTATYTTQAGDTEGAVAYSINNPTDIAGNVGFSVTSGTGSVTFDKTAPTSQNTSFTTSVKKQGGTSVTIASAGETGGSVWFAPNGTSTFAAGATMTTASGTTTSILTPATEGNYRLYVIDIAGNISSASTAVLTVDNTAPTLSNASIPSPTNNPTFTFTSNEEGTITYGGSCSSATTNATVGSNVIDFSSPTEDGTYSDCTVTVTDEAGNYSIINVPTFTADVTAPTVTVEFAKNPAPVGSMTISAQFSEALAGTPTISINQPGTTDISGDPMTSAGGNLYTYDYTVVSANGSTYIDGDAVVTFGNAADAAGNALVESPFVFTIDTVPPTITKTISTAQRLKSEATSTSNVEIDEVGSIYLVKNGTSATTQTEIDSAIAAKNAFLLTASAVAGQSYTVKVPAANLVNDGLYDFVAVDVPGNISAPSAGWLTIDNTPPTVPTGMAFTATGGTVKTNILNGTNTNFRAVATIVAGDATNGTAELLKDGVSFSTPIVKTGISTGDTSVTLDPGFTSASQVQTAFPASATLSIKLCDEATNCTTTSASNPSIAVDYVPPNNQGTVFPGSVLAKGGDTVNIISSGDATNEVWFAPAGTTTFVVGNNMTKATSGTATTIIAPVTDGTYKLFVIDVNGNYSAPSTSTLTVDSTPPVPGAPTSTAQVLKIGATSSSTIQTNEQGKIYFIKTGTTVATKAAIDAAISANNAFLAIDNAQANIPYTVIIPAGPVDGHYDIVAIDLVNNVSAPVSGWLTVDNTAPTSTITVPTDNALLASLTSIEGTATDTNDIDSVSISIQNTSTSKYYDGSGFTSGAEYMIGTTGTVSWMRTFSDNLWSSNVPYIIKSYAKDNAGNVQVTGTSITFTIDKISPDVDITYSANPAKAGINVITATYSEAIQSAPTISVSQQGSASPQTGTMNAGENNTYTFDYTVHSANGSTYKDGVAVVTLGVTKDLAGNNSNSATHDNFVIDTTAPTSVFIPICDVAGNGCTTIGKNATPQQTYHALTIAGTTSDVGSGVADVKISIKDTSANKYYSSGSFSSGSEVYLSATLSSDKLSWSYDSSGINFIIDNVYLIHSQSTDAAGNDEVSPPALSFVFSNSPPTVSNVTASEDTSGIVHVTYDSTDLESSGTTNALFYLIDATLSGNIDSSTTSISVTDATHLPTSGMVLLDDEIISYTGKSGNSLTGVTRGKGLLTTFSTPYAHTSGTSVYVYAPSAIGDVGLIARSTGKSITWPAKTDANGYENTNETVKVVANDGSTASMVGSLASAPFVFSVANPGVAEDSLLINDSSVAAVGTSPNITLKLQNIVGKPANSNIYVQFSRDGGITWYGANADNTFSSAGTLGTGFSSNPSTVSALSWPWVMQSRSETLTVKVSDDYSNYSTDTNIVGYNAPPVFDSTFGTDGIAVSQISDSADANWGKVKIQYSIKDTDTDGDAIPNFITPTLSYDTGSGFIDIADNGITYDAAPTGGQIIDQNSDGTRDNKVLTGSFLIYTAYWTPPADISTAAASFKVTIDDHEAVGNTASKTITNMTIDTKKPVITPVTFDAGLAGVSDSATITIPMPADLSSLQYKIKDDSSNSNPIDTGWTSVTANTTISWTFDADMEAKTIIYQFRDTYGNTTSEVSTSTLAPVQGDSFVVQDASNPKVPLYDMYVSWKPITDTTGFSSYKLEYATSSDNSLFTDYQSIGNGMGSSSTSYFVHENLDPTKYYRYRLGVVGTDGNISVRSGGFLTAKPDGVQNFGEGGGGGGVATASQVQNVVPTQETDKNVTITYRLTDSSLSKKTNPSYEARVFYNIGITLPANANAGGNITVSDASKLKSSGYIQINNEVIKYTGKTNNTLTGVTRGTWPNDITQGRATRQNPLFFAGTPVWVMATTSSPYSITDTSISYGQNGTITWTTYDESALAGGVYTNVGIRVLVHDNQDAGSGPLSTQNDYSENGILTTLDLNTPTVEFSTTHASGLQSVTPAVFTLNLSRVYPLDVTVSYTATGTAVGGGEDYTLANGTATITAGQTSTTISADIVDHQTTRPNKTIIVTLSNPTNATLGTNTVETYTIINHEADTTPPTVELVGAASMHVLGGTVWAEQDPGATATDNVDGNLTSSIVVTGAPDMSTPSTTPYIVTYSATDSSNNTGTATREVYVDDPNAATFDITVTQSDHGFITPDGTTSVHIHSDQEYTITPDEGYKVDSITIDTNVPLTPTVGVNHYTFHSVTAPHTITAAYVALPDTTKPTIIITGNNPVTSALNADYTDAGATASDTYLGVTTNLTSQIQVVSSVNTKKVGTYKVQYTVADNAGNIATASRTVNITASSTYTVTATAGANGSINPPGATQFAAGSDASYDITPDEGYTVATLTVDGTALAPATSHTFTSIDTDHSIAVTFSVLPDTTKPTITIIGPNPASLTAGDTYNDQGATAEDRYLGVTTNLTSQIQVVSNVNTSTPGNYTVQYTVADAAGNVATATRAVNVSYNTTYTITATAGANGSIEPVGTTSVSTGSDVVFRMTPNEGYTVASLIVDSVARANVNTYTFTNVVADHTIEVTFSALPDTTPPTITLNGINPVQLTVGDTYTDAGATAEDTYLGVTTDLTSQIQTLSNVDTTKAGTYHVQYTVSDAQGNMANESRTVVVSFNTTYTISATAGSNGSISPSGTISVLTGADKMFTITPDTGYVVATLTIDSVGLAPANSYTFLNVKADHTIHVTFSQNIDTTPPEIILNGDDPMNITVGDTFTDPGAIANDTVDGQVAVTATGSVLSTIAGTYTITYRASDNSGNVATKTRTVNVAYASSYTITATAEANGSISPNGQVAVTTHADQEFTITPESGYSIDTLTVDGAKLAPVLTHTFSDVKANHTINVTFTSTPDTTPPTISVTGNNPDTVIVKSVATYTDLGATAQDDRDGDVTTQIVKTGTVNTQAVGIYTITYTVKDSSNNTATATRTVTVKYADTYTITVTAGNHGAVDPGTGAVASLQDHTYTIIPEENYKVSSLKIDGTAIIPDTTYIFLNVTADHTLDVTFSLLTSLPPTILLNGESTMNINTGDPFTDPGATAKDTAGNDVPVITSGIVDRFTAGTYTLTYTATDSEGNTATATRQVIVHDVTPPVITDIATPVITTNAVAITWTTNEKANSQVSWGTAAGQLTNTTTLDNALNIYHVIAITGLTENTPYFYKVISADASSNIATSDEETFTTIPSVTTVINPGGTGTTNNPFNDNTSKFEPDLTPPKITNVTSHDVSAFDAKVSFNTNEDVLSFVEYGTTDKYGNNSADPIWGKTHDITIAGLKLGTLYHYRVTAIDKAGNATSTGDATFTTKYFAENTPDLTKIENVEQYQKEIESTIESILPALVPPFIEEPKVTDITENSATISFRTNIKAYPVAAYIDNASFDSTKSNPYTIETSDTSGKTLDHTLSLLNLKPNTLYHLQARAFSLPQVVGKSQEITFTTKASKIHGTILQKKYDSFIVAWTTNEPTTSIVEYKNLKSGEVSRNIDNTGKTTSHSIAVENLTQGTTYEVKISGVNDKGNVVEGDAPIRVTTLVDTTPPKIASFKVESSLVAGRTDRAQSIVSWNTDEPSTSIVYYEEGSGSPDKPLANKQEDTKTLTTNHVIILSALKPATIYRFQIASTDAASNMAKLPIRTIITPRQNESIVDVIFKNFDQTFNFLQNIK